MKTAPPPPVLLHAKKPWSNRVIVERFSTRNFVTFQNIKCRARTKKNFEICNLVT